MHRALLMSFCLASTGVLGACAHQPDSAQAANKRADSMRADNRQAQADDERRCEDMRADGRSLAITDCDMQAVDQALNAPQLRRMDRTPARTQDQLLSSDIPRLPATRRLGF